MAINVSHLIKSKAELSPLGHTLVDLHCSRKEFRETDWAGWKNGTDEAANRPLAVYVTGTISTNFCFKRTSLQEKELKERLPQTLRLRASSSI